MRFISFSFSGDQAVDKFNKFVKAESNIEKAFCLKKIALCDCQINLVTLDEPEKQHLTGNNSDSDTLTILFSAWQSVVNDPMNTSKQGQGWHSIDQVGETLQTVGKINSSPVLRHFRDDPGHDKYFILLNGKEPEGIPFADLYPLCNVWQSANNHFPLHAAGVIHKEQLFIFIGPSGAGKTTITELSKEIGNITLDEDQLLIFRPQANEYRASAWGYNLDSCDLPIRGIFNLIQDKEDRLVPLKPMALAQMLFERHNDVMGHQSTDQLVKRSFEFFAEVARRIPGFDLHFRKSPDFWKLIDERFSK